MNLEIFRVELIGQLVRRMKKDEAAELHESIVERLESIKAKGLEGVAFSAAYVSC